MVKFGQYLKHNIVPEWRDKYIDYKGFKKILKNSESTSRDDELESMSPTMTQLYSSSACKESFKQVDSHIALDMVDINGNEITEKDIENENYYSATLNETKQDALMIATRKEDIMWESKSGVISFQSILPKEYSTMTEHRFFNKLQEEISMVNQWYLTNVDRCKSQYDEYMKQVNHYKELQQKVGSKYSRNSREYRSIEFGIKELIRLIEYLKNYCIMNKTAIDKILKKHDKVIKYESRGSLMQAISNLSFIKRIQLTYLECNVEALWKEFTGEKTTKGLRDTPTTSHTILAFLVGVFSGMSILLLVLFVILVIRYPIVSLSAEEIHSLWYVFRLVVFIGIQMIMWSLDLYVYTNNRINYEFIFGKYYPKLLTYLQQCLYSTIYVFCMVLLMIVWYYCSFVLRVFPLSFIPYITPIAFVLLCLFILPIPGVYYQARLYMFLHTLRAIRAPFCSVQFPDFFIGDQMTSHNQTLLDFVHIITNLVTLSFLSYDDYISHISSAWQTFIRITLMLFPFALRLAQCLRRYHNTHDVYPHLYNGIKYALSIVSILSSLSTVPYIIFQLLYTCYALNWDIREDWGLLQNRNFTKWKWLRKKNLLSDPYKYHLAMISNVLLRFTWVVRLCINGSIDNDWLTFILGCLEVIRRGVWNIFRMENEQVSNCGKFRANVEVPVPFCIT